MRTVKADNWNLFDLNLDTEYWEYSEMKSVLINGFGRIGRCVFRNMWERGNAKCTYINEPGMTIENIIYLLKFDSIYGRFQGSVEKKSEHTINVYNQNKAWEITVGHVRELYNEKALWNNIQIIVDATGNEMCASKSWNYIENGIGHVIITNTFYDADFTYIMGHNDERFDAGRHRVISTSICDANATVPLLSKIIKEIGIDFCFVTTLHPWLSYQNLMDAPVRMQRRSENCDYFPLGRSSVNSVIPKTTTLGPVLEYVFPTLKDKLSYISYRTPTQMVASAELSVVLSKTATKENIIEILQQCEKSVVSLNEEDIISVDCEKQPYSSIVDMRWTSITDRYLKLITWYDNEWGYCSRVVDLINQLQDNVDEKISINHV